MARDTAALDALIARSVRTATPAVADSVAYPERQLSGAELVELVRAARLIAMATVGPGGRPHVAPVHAQLDGTTLRCVVYEDAVRRADIRSNPRVAFTTWRDGAVAILYGRAREVPGSLRDARPGRSGAPRRVVTLEVELTRAYAMRAPSARPAERASEPSRGRAATVAEPRTPPVEARARRRATSGPPRPRTPPGRARPRPRASP